MAVALVLDRVWREPPLAVHPVRLIGIGLDTAGRRIPAGPPVRAAVTGGVAWTVGAVAVVAAGVGVHRAAGRASPWIRPVLVGAALWPLLAYRMLLDEVDAVERALQADVAAGRAAVARIVSRDVSAASEDQVRQAAIESLGENLSDSVIAPLLWFGLGGLPAAALYRYANTADAVWGYRTPRWRHAGMIAARVDDLLNLVPARMTGVGLAMPGVRLATLRREAARTPSPNAGWPMAALALRLGVRLDKPGSYVLARHRPSPTPADTDTALRLVRRRGVALAGGMAVVAAVRAAVGAWWRR